MGSDSIIQVQVHKVTFQMGADYIGSPFYPDNQQVARGKWRKLGLGWGWFGCLDMFCGSSV